MKIINLHAENFKRLSAVDITPDSDVVILSGANEQGKSSVLDAIQAAVVGGRGMKDIPEPIRRGEDRAEVSLDLGELRIRRIWEPGKNRVEVTNADGAKYSSPQAMLDALTGSLTFDPLEFARMQPKDQLATLLRLVDLPFDIVENDNQRAALVQAETEARQDLKRAERAIEDLPVVPGDTPDEETPATDIMQEIRKREEIKQQNDQERKRLSLFETDLSNAKSIVENAENQVKEIESELEAARKNLISANAVLECAEITLKEQSVIVDALVDPDLEELDDNLSKLDEINNNVRQKKANISAHEELEAAGNRMKLAKNATAAHDKARADALATAKFPVDGLGFSDDGVTMNNLPFSQASESQRIKTSVAMGMAMNPKLRVMFVRDGSSLDNKRMAALSEMATINDFQLWIEKVDESGAVGIVIEDGRVQTQGESNNNNTQEAEDAE